MAGEEINVQRVGTSVTVDDVEIEAIERVVARVEIVSGNIIGVALKVPIAVVIRSPARTWRVDFEHHPTTSGTENVALHGNSSPVTRSGSENDSLFVQVCHLLLRTP